MVGKEKKLKDRGTRVKRKKFGRVKNDTKRKVVEVIKIS
jgi:hypothetical protein